jgi:hypothetical protein
MYRVFMALFLASALAGCATVSFTLSPEQVAGFRLTGVNIGFAPDVRIAWGEGELAYAASKGVASQEADSVANTPEGKAYLRNAIASKLKPAMQESLASQLNGSRPVRVDVTVKEVFVAFCRPTGRDQRQPFHRRRRESGRCQDRGGARRQAGGGGGGGGRGGRPGSDG